MNIIEYYLRYILVTTLSLLVIGCSSNYSEEAGSVEEVMNNVVTRLYSTLNEDELISLKQENLLSYLDEKEIDILSKQHWSFKVNTPVVVSVMRSKRQEVIPFWLEKSGFVKTDLEVKNENQTYEIWQKDFEAGNIELGINGFENFTYHYFISIKPQDVSKNLEIVSITPENQFMTKLDNGAFTYHDWTELVLEEVPESMKGEVLLTTIRGRGKESHLIGAFRKTKYPSTNIPDQVLLTWSSDPSSNIDIQWRTNTTVENGEVKYREVDSNEVMSVYAEKYVMEDRELMNDRYVHRFTAKINNLKPGTKYIYLIEPETDWNNARHFTTASNSESFSFTWFGDVHQKEEFGLLHNKAEADHPETAFYIIAGDLVDDGLYRNQWDELFENSKGIIDIKPLMNVPGNHDNRYGLGAKMYRDLFSYPTNGPDEVPKEQTYSFTYKNTLFLMLDATSPVEKQASWIENQLKDSDAKWKIAVFHFPPYNGEEPYLNIQEHWLPLFDEYKVDMVFSGHFHYYMRSKPINDGAATDSFNKGTTYIISLGIPGRKVELYEEPYAAVTDQNGWLYQHIKIDGKKLQYQSVSFNGNVIDRFEIDKEN